MTASTLCDELPLKSLGYLLQKTWYMSLEPSNVITHPWYIYQLNLCLLYVLILILITNYESSTKEFLECLHRLAKWNIVCRIRRVSNAHFKFGHCASSRSVKLLHKRTLSNVQTNYRRLPLFILWSYCIES